MYHRQLVNSFKQVSNKRQHTQMPGTLDSGSHPALIFQAVTGDTARQQFALFVDKLEQKVRVAVIDIFDTELAETAIFFAFQANFWIAEKLYIFS